MIVLENECIEQFRPSRTEYFNVIRENIRLKTLLGHAVLLAEKNSIAGDDMKNQWIEAIY